jgi:SAM-dependent methyltransferase
MVNDNQPTAGFWNNHFLKKQKDKQRLVLPPDDNDPILLRALQHFGCIKGKTVVDLGCGRGRASLFFAANGARVISVDFSEVAIANLTRYCRDNGFRHITPIQLDAREIATLGRVDFVFGSMILHHIEPFGAFAQSLQATVKTGGKGFFWENSSRSRMLIWFRKHLVGKLGIPKYGDPEEFPFTPEEISELEKFFHVAIEYPQFLFFEMMSNYLLRGRAKTPLRLLDSFFYRFPVLRRYSYRQYICLSR